MQDNLTFARPYAKAAFSFALERKAVAEWQQFLHVTSQVLRDPQTWVLRRNPHFTEVQLLELIQGVLGVQADVFMKHFLTLLTSRKRLALLPAIAHVFHQCKAAHEKIAEVDVYSVLPLSAVQLQQLSQKLAARLQRKVALREHLDESLLGGLLIRTDDVVIDGSIRGQLNRLTHALTD